VDTYVGGAIGQREKKHKQKTTRHQGNAGTLGEERSKTTVKNVPYEVTGKRGSNVGGGGEKKLTEWGREGRWDEEGCRSRNRGSKRTSHSASILLNDS